MSDDYTRRDYALDDPDSVQSRSVTESVNESVSDPEESQSNEQSPGHESDERAIEGYCGGSRNTREPQDKANALAAKFEDFQ